MKPLKVNGFGLIEVLVALAILAVGLLAVGAFQTSLVSESTENKTRAEAIALAQSRIEELRNYTKEAHNAADFATLFVNLADGNATEHTGTNAVFTRSETISQPSTTKKLTVQVTWVDPANITQQVDLTTEIAFESPSISGELDDPIDERLVRSATGRAKLGDGQVTGDEKANVKYTNGDLTGLLDRGDGDLRLTSGDDVVLTLLDACEIGNGGRESECTGFVEISGRIYIDTAVNNSWQVGHIFVKASDAAFCQRYYNGFDDLGEPKVYQVTGSTTSALTTENGDYNYYDYTCYLGGGWHGNIGIVFADGTGPNVGVGTSDKVCQGDPTAGDAWKDPRVASRRVYRGMTYLLDEDGEQEVGYDGLPIYYSIGVKDAMKLPDASAVPAQAYHDFVVTKLADNDGASCIGAESTGPMMREDSNSGELFAGVPTDFYCLNEPAYDVDGNKITYVDKIKMDAFGFEIDDVCPFDPSDPPSAKYVVTGNATILADENDINDLLIYGEPSDPLDNGVWFNTSDGVGNCAVYRSEYITASPESYYSISYQCDVFDWPDSDADLTGWNGYIQINADLSQMYCSTIREEFYDTSIVGDKTGVNFSCQMGELFYISGSITESKGSKGINNVSMSTGDGACNFDAVNMTYECNSTLINFGETWDGKITFTTPSDDRVCIPTPVLENGVGTVTPTGNGPIGLLQFVGVEAQRQELNVSVLKTNETCPGY